ncbi:MAG: phage major capsid protein [Lachnospiraceae bacterium]|nr:phage major capsid protein [Lachnospiraceae bacterium]
MFKKYLEKVVTEKREKVQNLETALIECEDREERAKMGETLTKLRDELNEAEEMLKKAEEGEDKGEDKGDGGNAGTDPNTTNQRMAILGTYGMGNAMATGTAGEEREKELKDLEKRGKELKEKRAVKIASKILLPKHVGEVLNDTFAPVSSLVDSVATEDLNGGETYEEAFVKSYGTGGIVEEGAEYTEAEPVFDYAPINKVKVTAYAEISEEVKKLPNIDYAQKVQEAVEIALKKKLAQQIVSGTGTKQLMGIFASPIAIDARKDTEVEAIDINTLNTAVFGFGGDEEVEAQATLILNKKTLKELSEVKKANGDPAYTIDIAKKTINTIPYIINSNVKDFKSATGGDFVMAYGDLGAYKMATFSEVEVMESSDYKFREGMICIKASVFVGGNVVKQDGFLRLKKKTQ